MSRKLNSDPYLCERPPTSSQTHRPSLEEVLLVREVDSVILNENHIFENSASKKIISRIICVRRASTPKLWIDASQALIAQSISHTSTQVSQQATHPVGRTITHELIRYISQP
jgi:hypothetical protein